MILEYAVNFMATVINPDIGDMELDESGEVVVHTVLGAEVAQRLGIRFRFFKREWFLNLDEGTPWLNILTKGAPDRLIRSILGQVITGTQGISELLKLSYSVSAARVLSVSFTARLEDGSTFRSTDYGTFTISL